MASTDVDINYAPTTQDPSATEPTAYNDVAELDDLDALFDYHPPDNGTRNAIAPNVVPSQPTTANRNTISGGDLGIDEEIKVRKARAPLAKLDEERLLSANGIPKLRRISKERLRFRGKGHEFSDVARLLTTYQLWLDGLFPKAKFADGINIIEKLGHKKRIQVMRRAWIDENRYKDGDHDSLDSSDDVIDHDYREDSTTDAAVTGVEADQAAGIREQMPRESRGLYSASPFLETRLAASHGRDRINEQAEEPDEDELDALLAEGPFAVAGSNSTAAVGNRSRARSPPDDFADEEEAMAEMGGIW